jgi:mobilome CxxCx(11)CxxC protein
MTDAERIKSLRIQCHNEVVHLLGTSFIFEQKAKKLAPFLKSIQILGVIIPFFVGGFVISFGISISILPYILIVASILSFLQLLLSGWSLASNWLDLYHRYKESQIHNKILADAYDKLGKHPPTQLKKFYEEVRLLDVQKSMRDREDMKYEFSNKEIRKGMRYALYTLGRQCDTCKKKPESMDSSNCGTCGKF